MTKTALILDWGNDNRKLLELKKTPTALTIEDNVQFVTAFSS